MCIGRLSCVSISVVAAAALAGVSTSIVATMFVIPTTSVVAAGGVSTYVIGTIAHVVAVRSGVATSVVATITYVVAATACHILLAEHKLKFDMDHLYESNRLNPTPTKTISTLA